MESGAQMSGSDGEGRTGSVIWHVTMSLDGFIAGPGDDVDWVFDYTGPNDVASEVIRSTGALLVGRRSYYVGLNAGPEDGASTPYEGAWDGPQFVLTRDPEGQVEDAGVTFLAGPLPDAVAMALDAAQGLNVVVIGADLARSCIEQRLIDELIVHLAPIMLGDGVRLFERSGDPVRLEPLGSVSGGQVTDLRFGVLYE
jgi:dihydrofolate reductase